MALLLSTTARAALIQLNGGSLDIGPVNTVLSSTQETNFSSVAGWKDGVIWAAYTLGRNDLGQATDEVIYSPDGGVTWEEPTNFSYFVTFGPINSAQLPDGRIVSIYGSQRTAGTTLPLRFFTWNTSTTPYVETRPTITFPFSTTIDAYRSLIVMPDGRWIQSAYGQRNGQLSFTSFTIQSADQGKSWTYLSTIATPTTNVDQSGPNETSLTLLADGSLLALVRQGHGALGPLLQSKSTDGGRTWSTPTTLDALGGLDPMVIRLDDNVLVASYGRRPQGVYLAVDFTGTGDHWQTLQVYNGIGSDYSSLVADGPDKVMLFYDISGYATSMLSSGQNRIVYNVIAVPEPGTAAGLGVVAGMAILRRKRKAVFVATP